MAGDGKRVALVIGNGAYTAAPPLWNPRNDANAVAGALAQLGFDVIPGLDLGRDAMEDKLVAFEQAISGVSAAMLFYAGHGLQVKGRNYLVPVDAEIRQEIQLKRRAFSLDEVLEIMARRAGASLVFLDACRDNPFSRSLLAGMTEDERGRYLVRSGLAEVKASQGSFVAFATAPDNVALDGSGSNSPFTEALLTHIETPDVSVSDMMISVRNDVLRATGGRQEPWDQSSLRERFCFKVLGVAKPEAAPPSAPEQSASTPVDSRTVEHTYWVNIQDSSDPNEFEDFLSKFPDGDYAKLAKARAVTRIKACGNNAPLKRLLRDHPDSERVPLARDRLGELAWNAIKASRDVADIEAFIARWAGSRFEALARTRLEALRRRAGRSSRYAVWMAGAGATAVVALVAGYALFAGGTSEPLPEPAPTAKSPTEEETAKAEARVALLRYEEERRRIAALEKAEAEAEARRGKVAVTVRAANGRDEQQWFTPGAGKTESFQDCVDAKCTIKGPEMVMAPAGSFMMGSPQNEGERDNDEGPQHKVTIGKPFAVGKYAVTFDEWDACVADGGCGGYKPSDQGWGRGDRPVINVSWDDAQDYVKWLSMKTGKSYRLLSEAEREYVTRAGTTTPFWWGSSITPDQANYDGNYPYNGGTKGVYRGKTVPVKSFQPNPWGLYQVHGNVWEWVEDSSYGNYEGTPTDGSAWLDKSGAERALRGGGWNNYARHVRAAGRSALGRDSRYYLLGFRCARVRE